MQKAATDAAVEAEISAVGGEVVADLHIIKALAVRAIPELASNPAVRWISPDGPVVSAGTGRGNSPPTENHYLDSLDVWPMWAMGRFGQGIGVAVIDSGVSNDQDFNSFSGGSGGNRLIRQVKFNPNAGSGLEFSQLEQCGLDRLDSPVLPMSHRNGNSKKAA